MRAAVMPPRIEPRKTRLGLEVDPSTSARMALIRQKDTAAEILVRRALRALGLGFRIRNHDLPGSPDIANRSRRWAVFVHGCFWHRHPGCSRTTTPKRNRGFWEAKFASNQIRDRRVMADLRRHGYTAVTVWECEAEKPLTLIRRLQRLTRLK